MIEIIDGVAYFNNYVREEQSLDMFNWLKEHPEQELYILKGANKHGCSELGQRVSFEKMPIDKTKNGFCINPFYNANIKPANAPNSDEFNSVDKNTVDNKSNDLELSKALEQINDLKAKLLETEFSLNSAINERDMAIITQNQAIDERRVLEIEIEQVRNKLDCMTNEYTFVSERATMAESLLNKQLSDDSVVSKTDICGLCDALSKVGFIVDLEYEGNELIKNE